MAIHTLFDQPASPASINSDTGGYTLGTEFTVSQPVALTGVWWYSASGTTLLPSQCGIMQNTGLDTGSLVTNGTTTSPAWSGAAGSGWVRCPFDGRAILQPGTIYRVCVFSAGGSEWYSSTGDYWSSGAGGSGLSVGPISAPNSTDADGNNQGAFVSGGSNLQYPNGSFDAANYWIDVEVSDVYVVQSFTVNDGSYAGAFDDDVTIGNTIVIVATGHDDTPDDKHDPLYNGAAVDGASQIVWANSTEDSETEHGSATTSLWLLPNVQTAGTTVSITDDEPVAFYVGIFVYEVANLGTSPTVVQADKAIGVDGSDQGGTADNTSSAAGNFVVASIVQDGLPDSNLPLGSPWVSTGLDSNTTYNSMAGYLVTSETGQTLSYLGNGDGSGTWSSIIAEIAPTASSDSITGAIKLKKMVLSGSSTEKSVATGAIKIKKMVVAGTGSAGIIVTLVGDFGGSIGDLTEAPAIGDTLFVFVSMYDVSISAASSSPTYDGGSVAGATQLWSVRDTSGADPMYSSAWMLPNLQSSSTEVGISSTGGSYPSPDGAFVFVKVSGLGSTPTLDRVITGQDASSDGAIGPTAAIRSSPELIIAQAAIYGSWPGSSPDDPWVTLDGGDGRHGLVSYQIAASSGGTYTWDETGNGNPWAGGIATIALGSLSSDSITGAIKLKKMVLAGSSSEKSVATGAIKLKKMVLSGSSTEKSVATGAIKLKKMVVAGSGIVWTAPYAAYAFDEGSGSSIIDYSGNSRNLTISGSNSWVTGHGSYANAFQSGLTSSDGAALTSGTDIAALSGDVTLQAWYKYTDAVPTGDTRMHIGGLYSTSGTARLALWAYRSLAGVASAPNFTIRDSSGTIIGAGDNGTVAEDNNWHNAACVYHANGLIEVYLDGTKVSSATPTTLPIGDTVLDIAVGSSYSGTPIDQGVVQDMRVFAGALNAAEIVHWMNTPVHAVADSITGAISLKKMVISGVSHEKTVATGAISLKKAVLSGASAEKSVATGTIKLKKMVLTGTGTEKPAITGVISLKKMVISGVSHEKTVITGSIHLKKMRVHGEEAKRKASTLFVFAPP